MTKIIGIVPLILVGLVCMALIIDVNDGTETLYGNDQEELSPDLYVFILAGQSQSAYIYPDISVANENESVRAGQAWYYGTDDHPPVYASDWASWDLSDYGIYSMTDSDGKWRIGSIEAPFASTFVNMTGKNILIINVGISGRSLESFIMGNPGEQYAQRLIDDALTKIPSEFTVHREGVIWLHGQANLHNAPEYYAAQFTKVYDQYKTLGFNRWVIEQPRASEAPAIQVANKIICDTLPNCYIGSTAGTDYFVNGGPYIADGTHYNQLGRNIVGSELAESFLDKADPSLAWHRVGGANLPLVGIIPILIIIVMLVAVVRFGVTRD